MTEENRLSAIVARLIGTGPTGWKERRSRPGRRTTARRARATTRRTATPPSSSTPTAITSRPSATAPEPDLDPDLRPAPPPGGVAIL